MQDRRSEGAVIGNNLVIDLVTLCHVTLSPWLIVMLAGEKPVLLIWTVTVAAEAGRCERQGADGGEQGCDRPTAWDPPR